MSTESSSKIDRDLSVKEEPVSVSENVFRGDVDTSGVNEKKLMRRIDLHVIPWLALLYFLNSLDRGSIGNAKLYNLEKDIHITDTQYLIALTVFFFPYSLLEPPSNVALKRLRPSLWLSFLILGWGVVMTLHGVMHDYSDLLTLRFFLGFFEAGLYPGIVFYISCWYKRSELGTRVALFFTSATIAGAFSGLLAAAISKMNGVGGKPGWAWIFILEGLLTVVCAVASFWIIQDFPDTAKFLSEPERVWVVRRLQEDQQFSAGGEKFKFKYVWESLRDVKTWIAMGIYMGFDGPLFAFSLFTPTIINQLGWLMLAVTVSYDRRIHYIKGFEATTANLLSVPVYAWACLMTLIVGLLGDRIGHRGYINLVLFGTGLASYIILIASRNASLSYFAVYIGASAIYPTIPNSVAWVSSNVEGSYKRSVTLAMAIGFGNLNGAVSSNVYRARDKPWYRMGHGIILAYLAIGWLCSLIFMFYLRAENARKDAGDRDEIIEGVDNKRAREINGRFASVEDAKRERGDRWSGFRHTL